MMRRWMLGLVVCLLVVVIASGKFVSTGGIDVPPSNAGSVTIPVDIELPADPCAAAVPDDTVTDEPIDDQSPDPAPDDRTTLGERDPSDPESGEPAESCEEDDGGGSDGTGDGDGEGEGEGQAGSDPDR